MVPVYVYGASIDENGKAHGGKAGNQTGRELRKQKWYEHGKGWRVFRAKNPGVAAKIAQCAKAAVANRHIGYDQYQRNTLYNEAVKYGFDVSKVTKDVETDCSALVRVCCAFAGVTGLPAEFRTTNEPALLLKTGAFTELVGDQYTKQSACLRAGDILCTKTQGHTVVVGNDGAKAEAQTPADLPEPQGLSRGDHGSAVETMQRLLLKWDAACLPKCGADGDFAEGASSPEGGAGGAGGLHAPASLARANWAWCARATACRIRARAARSPARPGTWSSIWTKTLGSAGSTAGW